LSQNIAKIISELEKLNEQLCNIRSRISKAEEDIGSRVKNILSRLHMNEIFEIRMTVAEDTVTNMEYLVNESRKREIARKYFGKKLILSDRVGWSTEEILKTYREQDCIEKIFRASKDNEHFSIRPQYHFTDQKIRVHIFCCLLGMTLAAILQKEIVSRGINVSKNQMLDRLSEIRRCWVKKENSNRAVNVLEEMDGFQAELWAAIQSL